MSFGPTPCTSRSSLGAAASAARAVPNRSSSALRIRGPTPEIRDSRKRIDQVVVRWLPGTVLGGRIEFMHAPQHSTTRGKCNRVLAEASRGSGPNGVAQ